MIIKCLDKVYLINCENDIRIFLKYIIKCKEWYFQIFLFFKFL